MKQINIKYAIVSSLAVYLIGIVAFVGSYYVPIMTDADLQANIFLMVAMIPAASFGAFLYYRKNLITHGLLLGLVMFLGAMILDALITVPLFIIPNGGDHYAFFVDPGFWLIGIEYVAVVTVYWSIKGDKILKN